ncbi:MAG: hypothetical protein QOJ57_2399, partial [Thermoleophilaceae bacterium]|nr:hypothetical protein [Thermoleophilaceae bacterium]
GGNIRNIALNAAFLAADAQLEVSGASIRNIALGGAFLAADARQPVRMSHLLAAARAEAAKLEQPVSPGELGGWT